MITRPVPVLAAAIAAATGLAGAAAADGIGKAEYMNSCAGCHGETAAGDGPLAALMTVEVPPLTGLAADNGGAFPMRMVIRTIDGRHRPASHGFPMPVWGARLREAAEADGPVMPELVARGRILSLAYYLESIQE
ncbi:c-type cytochrome [Roseovarius salinarum]|uniref:c-type cytochrome n=1 Tax=Roseovarius salinarum TaxID=1981892 RepID=UPI000C32DC18|nr:c-type cytochrome [Roseovarius salinarum]